MYVPETALPIALVVVVVVGREVLTSKSRGLYIILGPRSKHWNTLVANVFTEGNITFDAVCEIQSSIAGIKIIDSLTFYPQYKVRSKNL